MPESTPTPADAAVIDALKGTFIGGLLSDYNKEAGAAEAAPAAPPAQPEPSSPAPGAKPEPVAGPAKAGSPSAGQADDSAPVPDEGELKAKKKPRSPTPPPAPPLDEVKLAQSVATATVEAQRRIAEEGAHREALEAFRKAESVIPESVKKLRPVYEELHKANPDKYPADLSYRMARFIQAEQERADKWEAENAGQTYDSESEEHSDWYEKNQPKIDQDDVIDARATVKANEIIEKRIAPRQAEAEAKIERQQLDPELRGAAMSLGVSILKAVDSEFKDGIEPMAAMDSLGKRDPIAAEAAFVADDTFSRVVYEAGLLWNGVQKFNPQSQVHKHAMQILEDFEGALSQAPRDKIRKGNKDWLPVAQYAQLQENQRGSFYTTEYNDLVDYVRLHVAPQAAKAYYENKSSKNREIVEKNAERYGYTKSGAGNSPQKSAAQAAASPQVQRSSPSVPSGGPSVPSPSPNGADANDFTSRFFGNLGVR
jgi:hypothetical protein